MLSTKSLLITLTTITFVTANAVAGECSSSKTANAVKAGYETEQKNIVETAAAAGGFNTLLKAATAAGLAETLQTDGPFTVFAPTDQAFAKLPDGTVAALLHKPDQLAAILKFHIVPGRVMASDLVRLDKAKTLLGQQVSIQAAGGVRIGDANVIKTDITCSNGIIHVIDAVLLPENDILEVARAAGSFKTLLAAIDASGLNDILRGQGPFTVFAPTDQAFAKLPAGTVDKLIATPDELKKILTYHVVSGRVSASDVSSMSSATTVQGQELSIDTSSGVRINSAQVVKADVGATNGVIHVIDTVLLP